MLLMLGWAEVLIDAPIREGIAPYATSPSTSGAFSKRRARLMTTSTRSWLRIGMKIISAPKRLLPTCHATPGRVHLVGRVVERVRPGPTLDATRFRAVVPEPGASHRSMLVACRFGCCVFAMTRHDASPSSTSPSIGTVIRSCTSGTPIDGGELRCHAPIAPCGPCVASVLVCGRSVEPAYGR